MGRRDNHCAEYTPPKPMIIFNTFIPASHGQVPKVIEFVILTLSLALCSRVPVRVWWRTGRYMKTTVKLMGDSFHKNIKMKNLTFKKSVRLL